MNDTPDDAAPVLGAEALRQGSGNLTDPLLDFRERAGGHRQRKQRINGHIGAAAALRGPRLKGNLTRS
jgi:hypothetical protein